MSRTVAVERRLRRRAEFESVLREARRTTSRNFAAWARPNCHGQPRLGIVAGRKAAARAVDRNRAKRLIRETFGSLLNQMDALDIVVQLRTDLRDRDNATVRDELRRLLEKVANNRDAAAG